MSIGREVWGVENDSAAPRRQAVTGFFLIDISIDFQTFVMDVFIFVLNFLFASVAIALLGAGHKSQNPCNWVCDFGMSADHNESQ